MVVALVTLMLLYFGYVFYGKKLEKNIGVNIYNTMETPQDDDGGELLNYRSAQLTQLGLISGIECLLSAVIGILYGPLLAVWCVLGGIFIGSTLNYYCGMYAVTHRGKTLNYAIRECYGLPLYILSTLALLSLLVTGVCLYYSYLQTINFYTFGLPLMWYVYLLLVAFIGCSPQRWLNGIYISLAVVFLLALLLFFIGTAVHIPDVSYSWNMLTYPQAKFAYPVLVFTTTAIAASGFQSLSCSLLAPSVKNEKMGRGIFFGVSLLQVGFVFLLSLMIRAACPELSDGSIARATSPYLILHQAVEQQLGLFGGIIFYVLAVLMCAGSGGALLRVGRTIIAETGIFRKAGEYISILLLFAAGIACYRIHPNLEIVSAISGLLMLFLWLCCVLSFHGREKNIHQALFPLFMMSGAYGAYLLLIFAGQPLINCIALGLSLTVLLFSGYYFYNRRHKLR